MSGYICYEHKVIINQLEPFISNHNLDRVSVESLVKSCVEILSNDLPKASTSIIDLKNLKNSFNFKFSNIRINFTFGLNLIFKLKTCFISNDIWFVLSLLEIARILIQEATIKLNESDALVLTSIYRLKDANENEIIEYANSINPCYHNILDKDIVNESLKNLEALKSIILDDGKYRLCEYIYIKDSM